jgi:hypothetical protein
MNEVYPEIHSRYGFTRRTTICASIVLAATAGGVALALLFNCADCVTGVSVSRVDALPEPGRFPSERVRREALLARARKELVAVENRYPKQGDGHQEGESEGEQ